MLGSSGTRKLPAKATTLDLVIAPVGGIDGTIAGATGRIHLVNGKLLSGDKPQFTAEVDATGTFKQDNLVPGDYELEIFMGPGKAAPPAVRVTVVANKRTAATLTISSATITLAVHYAPGCQMMTMQAKGQGPPHEMLASAMCDDKGNGVIEGVTPGTYSICPEPTLCSNVTVTPTPPRQVIEIPVPR